MTCAVAAALLLGLLLIAALAGGDWLDRHRRGRP